MAAKGRWFISPHAVRQYQMRVEPWLSYRQALGRLIRHSMDAHHVRQLHDDGTELWRGPRPHRLRFVVAPPDSSRELRALLTVMRGCDEGLHH